MTELRRRKIEDVDAYAPFFLISYACHVFNLINRERHIYTFGGLVPNMRVPVLFMAPPGCGKSYLLKHLTDKMYGIFATQGEYPITLEQGLTEAGLIGTRRANADGTTTPEPGAAYENRTGFIVIDEFSAISAAMKAPYNSQLESQLLTALDSGNVRKRLATGRIEYHTDFTLWCGIQPIKCDLSGGLGRRMALLLNIPNRESRQRYKNAAKYSDNITIDIPTLFNMRDRINMWCSSLGSIKKITIDESLLEYLDHELDADSAIMDFYKRIIIGYHLIKYGASSLEIVVKPNDELLNILETSHLWREQVTQGPEIQQIIEIISQNAELRGREYYIDKLTLNQYAGRMHLSASQLHAKLTDMHKYGYIKMNGDTIVMPEEAARDVRFADKLEGEDITGYETYVDPDFTPDELDI